jgi:hypothetical protein
MVEWEIGVTPQIGLSTKFPTMAERILTVTIDSGGSDNVTLDENATISSLTLGKWGPESTRS